MGLMFKVDLTCEENDTQRWVEIKVNPEWTVSEFKNRISTNVGAENPSAIQILKVFDAQEKQVSVEPFAASDFVIGNSGLDNNWRFHLKLPWLVNNSTEDTGDIPKYRLSDEEYAKRSNLRQLINQHKRSAMQTAEQASSVSKTTSKDVEALVAEKLSNATKDFPVGARCEISSVGSLRGTIAYVGTVGPKKRVEDDYSLMGNTIWIGIRLDDPLGDTDGTGDKNKKLFDCEGIQRGGIIVPSTCVRVGDFPVENDFLDEEEI